MSVPAVKSGQSMLPERYAATSCVGILLSTPLHGRHNMLLELLTDEKRYEEHATFLGTFLSTSSAPSSYGRYEDYSDNSGLRFSGAPCRSVSWAETLSYGRRLSPMGVDSLLWA